MKLKAFIFGAFLFVLVLLVTVLTRKWKDLDPGDPKGENPYDWPYWPVKS